MPYTLLDLNKLSGVTLDLDNKTDNELTKFFAENFSNSSSLYINIGLDTGWSDLEIKSGNELAKIFARIPQSVTSLDLSQNNLDKISGDELAIAFAGIPPNVTLLDLTKNNLKFPENIERLRGTLPHVQTIYLSFSEIKTWSIEQCKALKEIMPQLNHIIFRDEDGNNVFRGKNPKDEANLLRKFGIIKVPSLLKISLFQCRNYLNLAQIPKDRLLKDLPSELQERLGFF